MNKQEFIEALLGLGFTHDAYNTNNAWGFGGGIGDRYTKGEAVVKIGTAYFRHHPPSKYLTVAFSGRRVLDRPPTPSNFERALKVIQLNEVHGG